jgi:hypothetical protein
MSPNNEKIPGGDELVAMLQVPVNERYVVAKLCMQRLLD